MGLQGVHPLSGGGARIRLRGWPGLDQREAPVSVSEVALVHHARCIFLSFTLLGFAALQPLPPPVWRMHPHSMTIFDRLACRVGNDPRLSVVLPRHPWELYLNPRTGLEAHATQRECL